MLLLLPAAAQVPVITTMAGAPAADGEPGRGYSGDGGPAVGAALALSNLQNDCDPQRFEQLSQIFVDGEGSLYVADSGNQRIRRVGRDGIVTTVAGSGERPAVNERCLATGTIGDGGPALATRLFNPSSVVLDRDGNLILADQQNNRIRRVNAAGVITSIAGSGLHNLYAPGIPATISPMDWPAGLAISPAGLVHFTEVHGNRVGRINADGRLATVAGNGFPGSGGDGGSATAAQLRRPTGIGFDREGNLYIADTGNHRIRRVGPDGVIRTVAGNGEAGFGGDGGAATEAALQSPMDVKADSKGNLYIADAANHRIRRVDAAGVITTIAGGDGPGRGPEYVPATESLLAYPSALAVDGNDDLWLVDWQNYRIRKITFSGLPAIAAVEVGPEGTIVITGVNLTADVKVNGEPVEVLEVTAERVVARLPAGIAVGTAVVSVGESNKVEIQIADPAAGL